MVAAVFVFIRESDFMIPFCQQDEGFGRMIEARLIHAHERTPISQRANSISR